MPINTKRGYKCVQHETISKYVHKHFYTEKKLKT